MNSAIINLHGYYSNNIFLHNFAWSDVSEFWAWLGKMWYCFYYTSTNASALSWDTKSWFCPTWEWRMSFNYCWFNQVCI